MRRIIASTLLLIVLISTFYINYANAFEIKDREVYSKGECERLLTYKGIKVITSYVVYNDNGVEYPAYCLDVTKPGAETGNYILHGGSKVTDVNVWRAVTNGYPYKSVAELGAANESEAYTATKHAIYSILYNRDISEYGPIDSDAGRRTYEIYKNIVNAARGSNEPMVTDIVTSLSTDDILWNIDDKDNKYVSKVFKLNSNVSHGRYDIHCDRVVVEGLRITNLNNEDMNVFNIGESFKILIPINMMKENGNFEIIARTEIETKPVVYGTTTVPGKQDYALTGHKYEEQYTGLVQEYNQNLTKLRVVKKEYNTEKRLPGVKFNLLNENKEIILKDIVTDGNGEIVLINMFPGKYYLEEVETLDGYVLYTDLIEIGLDYNEEFEVVVNNRIKEVTEVVKDYESVEVIPSKEELVITENTKEEVIVKNEILEYNNFNAEEKVTTKDEVKRLPKTGY